jgi:hypothetical protein
VKIINKKGRERESRIRRRIRKYLKEAELGDYQMKDDEIDRACSMHGIDQK